jgi:hypothetical protein
MIQFFTEIRKKKGNAKTIQFVLKQKQVFENIFFKKFNQKNVRLI